MKSVIYETKNLYNEKHGILPYLYIGSQQSYTINYLGSSKTLLEDIKKIGVDFFEKKILCEFNTEIDNKLLRKIESNIQKSLDVANNPIYYNRTNSSHKGYIETDEEKNKRMSKTLEGRKKWWDNLTEEEKNEFNKKCSERITNYSKKLKGKTYEEIYGEEFSKIKRSKISGEKNGLSKKVIEISTNKIFGSIKEIKEYLGIKKNQTIVKMCLKGDKIKFL